VFATVGKVLFAFHTSNINVPDGVPIIVQAVIVKLYGILTYPFWPVVITPPDPSTETPKYVLDGNPVIETELLSELLIVKVPAEYVPPVTVVPPPPPPVPAENINVLLAPETILILIPLKFKLLFVPAENCVVPVIWT
jgi:hypothetical protein